MCSSGGQIAKTDEALQKAQATTTQLLNQNYSAAFGEQTKLLAQQAARLNYMAANPLGYKPEELHAATTNINENTANAAKQAIGAAAAFAAAHGAADVGGGGAGMIAGQIASQAAQSKAQQLSELSASNAAMKQQNLWKALSGLQDVGQGYGSEAGQAISGGNAAAGTSINAGTGALDAKNAAWQHFGSVLSGIGGLAKSVIQPIPLKL